jgi:hypothetical protein
MLSLKTLLSKKFFTKNGSQVVDLIRRSISFLGIQKSTGEFYIVERDLEMRPDLIANAFLQDVGMSCLMMKYNGISNPFSIHEGMILRIPDSEILSSMLVEPEKISDNRVREAIEIVKPKTRQDKNRLDYLKAKGAIAVPTSFALDESVKVVNGRIIFGSDVTSVKKEDCPEPISRAKLKETLLKNKIFG